MARRRAHPYPIPRWQTPLPDGVAGSWGPDVADYAARELGIELGLAQRRALNRALAVNAAGRLLHRIYLFSEGRQSGKTVTVRSLIGWALTAAALPEWATILGLAFDKKQARIPYRAVAADLRDLARRHGPASRGGLSITTYLGIRSGMHNRHRSYDIASREARAAIRGESIDLAPFDEVRTQRDIETWAALIPATAARPEPLTFLTSTAGDARSILLRQFYDRGLRIIDGVEPAAGFGMTWYAADDDDDPDDLDVARKSTPAIAEGRISLEVVQTERYSLTDEAYRTERLNLWVDDLAGAWLPAGVWSRQVAPQPITPAELEGARVILGIEATPTWRRASIVAAIRLGDGSVWAGVVADLDASSTAAATIAPSALVDELSTVARAWRPQSVAYSAAAAAAPHVAAWSAKLGIPAVALTATQLRQASELLRSELVGGRLTHADDPLLATQARSARPSGPVDAGAWYLSIRESLGEVDAVRAIAWAAWAAIAPEAQPAVPQIFA
jgi:hypothetical protein